MAKVVSSPCFNIYVLYVRIFLLGTCHIGRNPCICETTGAHVQNIPNRTIYKQKNLGTTQ